jgi:glycosyltransferase involved in cell wall biosynthesis
MGLGLPAGAYCVAVPAVALLTILPLSISGVGIREGGLVWMLASYGVNEELAVTLGLLWFLITVSSGMIGGIVYLFGMRSAASDSAVAASDAATVAAHPADQSGITPLTPCGRGAGGEGNQHQSPQVPEIATNQNQPIFNVRSALDDDLSPATLPMSSPEHAGWSLSVVVPVYDEVDNLDPLVEVLHRELVALAQSYEILLVDDGSTDGSAQRIDDLAAEDERVKAVHLRRNYGQTAALDAGIHLASGDVIITLDADLQNDPADIPAMLEKLAEGYDLVHGWRKERQDALVSRRVPSLLANWLISRVTGFAVHDLGCTLKAMRRETAQELHLYGEMHRFIPILAYWNGARCAEMVTRHHPRLAGKSKYGLSRTIRVLFDLVTVKYMIQYLTSPMKLFGMLGLAAGFVGLISATITFGMWLDGFHLSRNPLLLLSIFAGFVSVQFFVLGLLGELGVRTYYESQDKRPYGIRQLVNFDEPASALEPGTRLHRTHRRAG